MQVHLCRFDICHIKQHKIKYHILNTISLVMHSSGVYKKPKLWIYFSYIHILWSIYILIYRPYMVCLIRNRNKKNSKRLPQQKNTVRGRQVTVTDLKYQSQCSCTFRLCNAVNVHLSFTHKFCPSTQNRNATWLGFYNSMEHSPSLDITSSSSGQETSCSVWNSKVHYHTSPTPTPFRVHTHHPVRTIPIYGLQVGPLDVH